MGFCKYYKQKKIVSYDSGTTWQDVIPYVYHVGELYEIDSPDCSSGESLIRWTLVPGDYLCEGKDKYEKEIEEYSIDGVVWKAVYPTTYRKGRLLERYSDICDNKWEGHYNDDTTYDPIVTPIECPAWYKWVEGVGCVYVDPIKFVRCSTSTSTTLTRGEVTYNPYDLIYGYIGDCVDTIGNGAFSGMTEISYMDIPSSVTIIGAWAFLECTSLSSITIPDSVTWIGDNAFAYCYDLSNVTIGSGVTTIGYGAFRDCSNLESIFVDSNNSVYDSRNNCNAIIETSTNKLITGSKNTIIPPTTTSIGNYAFYGCSGLTSIDIPSGITSIGGYSFTYCSGLTSVTVNATTPPTLGSDVFDSTNDCPIYVPCESIAAYKSASGWTDYLNRIQAITPCKQPIPGVTKYYATYLNNDSRTYMIDCNSSTELTSGDTRPSRYTASSATSIYVGNCLSSLGDGVFKDFTSISSCTFETNSQLTTIGSSAFTYCSGLTSINIPDSVTSIGRGAFINCSGLTSCTIGSGVTTIGSSAFTYCSGLTSINIPDSVTSIGRGAFINCSGLTSCTIGSGVTTIGSSAFYNCISLSSCTIGSGVTTIGGNAFSLCSSLTSIEIPNSVTTIGSGAFSTCGGLTSIVIPTSVTFIGYRAFNYCSGLLSITVNSSTPPELESFGGYDVFGYTNNCPIYVPSESVNTYKSASGWSNYASRIQAIP